MIVRWPSVAVGVNADAAPEELLAGAWSFGENVMFRGGFLERAQGMAQLFATPTITPYFIAPFRTATAKYWIHFGLAQVYVDDGTTRTEITHTTPYTGAAADRWTGGAFNGVFIANNGVEPPQFWNGNTATNFANLTNWTANYTCKSIRAFGYFLVAFDITKSGTRYPFRVLWSAIADPGSVPPSWDITDATKEAGEVDIGEAGGPLVDALQMGDQLIVYTTASAHAMRYVGGQNVFSFAKIGDFGMLARNCGATTPIGHVVMTPSDVILHAGGNPKSVASGRVRKEIFDNLDPTYAERACFVVANPAQSEVWVCYPEVGNSSCTKAAVWNWEGDTWAFRTLRNATFGASGQVPDWTTDTWATATGTWATMTGSWSDGVVSQNDRRLVMCHATPAISVADSGTTDVGLTVSATAERIGLHFDDPQRIKLVRSVWPRIDAPAGTVVSVTVGASMTPDVDPTWGTAVNYTVGTSTKVDSFASGRLLALRLSSDTDAAWRLRGLDLDIVPQGMW